LSEAGAFRPSTTLAEANTRLTDLFRRRGIETPGREARLTLLAACHLSPIALIAEPERPLGARARELASVAARRAAGEPLSRIVGNREFWGLALAISPDVLDPRPETETIVEVAIALCRDRRMDALRILDLGVGSGALLCALLTEFANGRGLGVDICVPAAKLARHNIEACSLARRAEIRVADWTKNLVGPFDLIVSNPPYVRSADIAGLSREVRDFDPRLALDGGPDGFEAYRAIVPASASLLAEGGWLIVEVGAGQAAGVLAIAMGAGFARCAIHRDIAGLERVITARSPRAGSGRGAQEGASRRDCVNVKQ
jgi:release factor glutamine methyltransferase